MVNCETAFTMMQCCWISTPNWEMSFSPPRERERMSATLWSIHSSRWRLVYPQQQNIGRILNQGRHFIESLISPYPRQQTLSTCTTMMTSMRSMKQTLAKQTSVFMPTWRRKTMFMWETTRRYPQQGRRVLVEIGPPRILHELRILRALTVKDLHLAPFA